ncbi:MAG: 50S ribosomal protein L25 [Candidatus Dormibacteria bacterium]
MVALALAADSRSLSGRHVRALRRTGVVPAVVYGHRVESTNIAAEERALRRVWRQAGRTHLIALSVDGHRPRQVLFRELQVDPRTARPIHADFLVVNLREKLTAEVPIIVVGEAPAVAQLKVGQLLQTLTMVRVECLPADLPAQLSVDVSGLTEVEASLTLGDLELPSGVTISADLGEMVVKIAPLRVQQAEEVDEGTEEAVAADGAGPAAPGEESGSG